MSAALQSFLFLAVLQLTLLQTINGCLDMAQWQHRNMLWNEIYKWALSI